MTLIFRSAGASLRRYNETALLQVGKNTLLSQLYNGCIGLLVHDKIPGTNVPCQKYIYASGPAYAPFLGLMCP